jgi:ABC-type phosphate/phosphonate transport system substrate-binding protein
MNPRGVIKALAEGRIDVGPLDSYCHDLIRDGDPGFAGEVRILESTDPTPMPPIVATAALDPATVERLRAAFLAVAGERSLASARTTLLLERFVVPDPAAYDLQQQRAHAVESGAPAWP